MSWTVSVENIKCGGCARSIEKGVSALPGVRALTVNVDAGEVTVDADPALRVAVLERLSRLGYPERGELTGFGAASARAKSFVSCAIGKVS